VAPIPIFSRCDYLKEKSENVYADLFSIVFVSFETKTLFKIISLLPFKLQVLSLSYKFAVYSVNCATQRLATLMSSQTIYHLYPVRFARLEVSATTQAPIGILRTKLKYFVVFSFRDL
jgi:hypothetical protein